MTQSSIDGFSTASQMRQALRQRQLSAVELLALHQRRIERSNPRLNAIIIVCFEQARKAAEAADAARARGADSTLLGAPITLQGVGCTPRPHYADPSLSPPPTRLATGSVGGFRRPPGYDD
jgi:hypothetical protein